MAEEDRLYAYGVDQLGSEIVASKYFNLVLEHVDVEDWRDIPTPALSTVMEFQGWPLEVQEWLCILLGRLLYPLNAKDKWQGTPSSAICVPCLVHEQSLTASDCVCAAVKQSSPS
jgi:hypothetical protein